MQKRRAGEITTFETRTEAHETVDKRARYRQIIEILYGKEMTAKEIAVEMFNRGYTINDDRNNAAPRLTELSKEGIVEPIGKQKCEYTGKTVAVYAIRNKSNIEGQMNIYDCLKGDSK